jgi:TRAP-type C4-dicarboxylate transport system permease large subunit
MDGFAMIILTIPVLFPVIRAFGFDTIWFGVLMVIILEIGLVTPPVGLNVYVIKGVAGDVPMDRIFRGIMPFLIADVIGLVIVILFPQLATYIPYQMK